MRVPAVLTVAVLVLAVARCAPAQPRRATAGDPAAEARARMVREQIEARGVRDPRVLDAMRRVPRHLFVPEAIRGHAYDDRPLPIGHDQTISQPYIVAWMTEALKAGPGRKVLEVGTGSGYQAAVLAAMGVQVYTIEIVAPLAEAAARALAAAGFDGVHRRVGDGYAGWPEHAPFDAVIVTAAPDHVPQPLVDQLAVGGRLVIPVGRRDVQWMTVITKEREGRVTRENVMPVLFVPLVRTPR